MANNSCQICKYIRSGVLREERLPPEDAVVLRRIRWGSFSKAFTPAYWKMQIVMCEHNRRVNHERYRMATTLSDEICFCLLGGFGISAEIGYAAYLKLKQSGLTSPCKVELFDIVVEKIYNVLASDLLACGKVVKYRFPRQKALRIAKALVKLDQEAQPEGDLAFRDWLLTFNGIGPKTASWITRNWLGSDSVAIIDIHIFRACTLMGLFNGKENVAKEYSKLERKFIELARAIQVKPSEMDLIIWMRMREMGRAGAKSFKQYRQLRHWI